MREPSKKIGSTSKRKLLSNAKHNKNIINDIANELKRYFNNNNNRRLTPKKSTRRK